jgi:hypothetical protein
MAGDQALCGRPLLYGPRLPGVGNVATTISAKSLIDKSLSVKPAAIAWVRPSVLWMRVRLYQKKSIASAWQWFSNFFENAFVSRVNRRIAIRVVKFYPSANHVEIWAGSGVPFMTSVCTALIRGGL